MRRVWLWLSGLALVATASWMPLAWGYTPLASPHPFASNWSTTVQTAQRQLAQGDYLAARDSLTQAIEWVPQSSVTAPLYQQLAWAYVGLNEAGLAIASLQTAIRLSHGHTIYYENMVDIWQRFGQLPTAQKQLEAVLRYDNEQGDGWFLLGLMHYAQGQQSFAETAWQQHLLLHPRSTHRGFICNRSGVCVMLKEAGVE